MEKEAASLKGKKNPWKPKPDGLKPEVIKWENELQV